MSGVWNAAQRRRRVNIGRILLSLGFLITAISLITLNAVNAATNPFRITDVSITAKSSEVDANVSGFEDTKIISGVTFYHLDDSVTYQITLNNSDIESHTINSITDDNASPYLTYNYSTHAGEEIAAGADLVLEVEVVYSTEVSEVTARAQNLNIKFSINYETEDEIAVPDTGDSESSATVPNTGANTNDSNSKLDLVPLIFVGIGALLIIMGLRKSKLSTETKVIALALLGTFVTVSAVNAISNDFTFEFENNVDLQSILVVTYTVDGQETTVVIPYGGTLTLDDPAASTGYNFSGWEDENGEEFDPSEPVTGDISISPVFKPNQFTVSIDTTGDGNADTVYNITYGEEECLLQSNTFTQEGHHPSGWVDEDDNYYADGTDLAGLDITDGGSITLVPNMVANEYDVYVDTDNDGTAEDHHHIVYGEGGYSLPTNNLTEEGYTPDGWIIDDTQYGNGSDLSHLLSENGATINVYPYFEPITYYLVIDIYNNYEYELVVPLKYNEEYELPVNENQKRGHAPNGWVDEGISWSDPSDDTHYDSEQIVKELSSVNESYIMLSADWSPITYTVDYEDVYDQSFLAAAPTSFSYQDLEDNGWRIDLPAIPEREGYAFIGWIHGDNSNNLYSVNQIMESFIPTDGTVYRLRAAWEEKSVEICYFKGFYAYVEVNGSSVCDTVKYWDDSYYFRHNYYTTTGYTPLDGWGIDIGGGKVYDGGSEFDIQSYLNGCTPQAGTNTCLMNIQATWEPHQTTVSFLPGEGVTDATGSIDDRIFTYNQAANFPVGGILSRPGYAQAGWVCDATPGTVYALGFYTSNWNIDVETVTCNASWRPNEYTIQFVKNANDATGGMASMNVTYGDNVSLSLNEFTREGYGFVGWKWNNEGELIADGANAGQFPADHLATVNLYAQWEEASSGNEYEAMQSMTTAKCAEMEVGTMVNLQDTRDNKVYRVGKLADNNCWMLDTLKIANVEISDKDSDLPEDTTFVLPDSNNDAFEAETKNTPKLYIDPINNHGVFYSYYTATAGWGVYGNDNLAATTTDSPQSICPKGWKLPNGGNSYAGDFNNLVSVYGKDQTAYMGEFPGFELDGALYSSNGKVAGPADYGHNGYFWSSTNRSKWFANRFLIVDDVSSPESSGVFYDFNYYKYWENNIICMAR